MRPTISQILSDTKKGLKKIGIKTTQLDAEILLAFLLKKNREYLLSHNKEKISNTLNKKYQNLITRHQKNEPVAYIINRKEFYGLNFIINKNVLIPRPETELMVEKAIKLLRGMLGNNFSVVPASEPEPSKSRNKNSIIRIMPSNQSRTITCIDVGTGSGCIITSLAKNLENYKNINFFGVDISSKALKVAKKNTLLHNLDKKISFKKSDLLSEVLFKNCNLEIENSNILILANLPYLSQKIYNSCSLSVKKYEPKKALLAGKDGLDYYRKLLNQIKIFKSQNLKTKITTLLEISPEQKNLIEKEILERFPQAKIKLYKDLAKKWRLVEIKIK